MKIQKRDLSIVEFDKQRIINAIQKASQSVHQSIPDLEPIIQRIIDHLPDENLVHIEQIQDVVEQELMNAGYYHIVRHYITYRNEKQKQRDMGVLNLKNLPDIEPPFKELGYITYKRTYARQDEEFKDTILRVLIGCQKQLKVGFTNEELKTAYEHFMRLRGSVAGRFLWQLNTETVNRFGLMSLQNCAFCKVDSLRAFTFLKDVLMLGVGCGVNVQRHNVDKIPPVLDKEIHITRKDTKDADFIIPDSREGWVSFLEHVLDAYFVKGKGFTYSTILIRSAGSPINGFGGVASGPQILCEGIANICQVLDKRRGQKVRPIDCMDIADIIGSIVVAGNVRRCLPLDTMIHTKQGMIPLQDVEVGHEVLTSYGVYERVRAVYHQGKQRIVNITTAHGNFRCTAHHKMAVWADNKIQWKQAMTLNRKDRLLTCRMPILGSRTQLPPYQNRPILHDTSMAWFLGYYLQQRPTRQRLHTCHFQVAMKIKQNLLRFDPDLIVQFYKLPNNCFRIYMKHNTTDLHLHLSTHFPIHQIPEAIWKGHLPIRKAFLAGVWDASGRKLCSSSEKWIQSLQSLSYSCGMEMKKTQLNPLLFQLTPASFADKILLLGIPELIDKKKIPITFWERISRQRRPPKFFNTIPVRNVVMEETAEETMDITVENEHNFYANGYLTHNSAILVMGDADDKEYLNAKRWDLGNIPNYRAMSNNSVICNDIHQLPEEFWAGYHGNGEPYGLINLDLARSHGRLKDGTHYPDVVEGFNPCLTSDTWVMTSQGWREIKDLIHTPFQALVEGGEYPSTQDGFWHNGVQSIFEITLDNGMKVKSTENHRFMTTQGWKKVGELVPQSDQLSLCLGVSHPWSGIGTEDEGYIVGFLMGNKVYYYSHIPKVSVLLSNHLEPHEFGPIQKIQSIYHHYRKKNKHFMFTGKDICYQQYTMTSFLFKEMAQQYQLFGDDGRIHVYEKGSFDFTIGLLRGLFDSSGVIYHNLHDKMSIRLWEDDVGVLRSIQRLLLTIGISTKISENELILQGDENVFQFQQHIGFLNNEKRLLLSQYKPLGLEKEDEDYYSTVVSVNYSGKEDVYDCTIDKVHCFSANGILSHNCAEQGLANFETCCLSEIFLPNIQDYDQLTSVATTLYRICKHSLLLPCHHPETEKIVHDNMRMGIGVSGILQSTPTQLGWLDPLYQYLREYDREYSQKLGVPTSIKLTTVKPSGTLSLLGGCTPGVHPALYRYYIRRIRIASTNPLVELCRNHGYHVEFQINFDGTFDTNTMVVEFPCKSAENAMLSDNMSAIDQLEVMKNLQTEWSDNSISISCYHTKEELPLIRQWLEKNYNQHVKTVSFLLRYDSGFKQMPYESITKETYEELIQKVRPITSGMIQTDDTDLSMECPSGVCPVK